MRNYHPFWIYQYAHIPTCTWATEDVFGRAHVRSIEIQRSIAFVTENIRLALRKTYDAVPEPKIVIAVGACAISGGLYAGRPKQRDGAPSAVPVDLFVPGCPPHPLTILDGLLRLIGRIRVSPDS